jgi:LysR family glycine cleavage system transcriptional activator
MTRIPPIQCLLTFEALARLRSVTQTADELNVTPSAVSHRVKQLEQILGTRLFGRADFSLTTEGSEYLAHVREGLASLERFPGKDTASAKRKLRVAVTPTFSRSILMPRLRGFIEAYPEIDLTLQVSIPLLDVVAEDADLMVRFGTGRYADVEHTCLMTDEVTPLASPAYIREHGPFDTVDELLAAKLIKSPLEPWRTWFLAHGVDGRAGRRLQLQRHRPDVRRRRAGPGHCAGAPEAGRALAGQRHAGAHLPAMCPARMPITCAGAPAPWTAGNARPLPTGCARAWPERGKGHRKFNRGAAKNFIQTSAPALPYSAA